MSNLGEYVSLVVDATVNSGISRQVDAFKSGFNQVCDIVSILYRGFRWMSWFIFYMFISTQSYWFVCMNY